MDSPDEGYIVSSRQKILGRVVLTVVILAFVRAGVGFALGARIELVDLDICAPRTLKGLSLAR